MPAQSIMEGIGGMAQARYHFGEFDLDPASRELWRTGIRVPLPPKSLECLVYLVEHRDRAVGRDELIAAVWGRVDVSDTVVAQTLLRARKALDDTGARQAVIRTVPRFGYQWVADVQQNISLEIATPPSIVPMPPARPRRLFWILLVSSMLSLLAIWLGTRSHAHGMAHSSDDEDETIIVLPVGGMAGHAEYAWIRLGAMDYIASRLRSAGMRVMPSDQMLHLITELPAQANVESQMQALRHEGHARWVMGSDLARTADGWRMRLFLHDQARVLVIETVGPTPLAAARAASDAWLEQLGKASEGEASAQRPAFNPSLPGA